MLFSLIGGKPSAMFNICVVPMVVYGTNLCFFVNVLSLNLIKLHYVSLLLSMG